MFLKLLGRRLFQIKQKRREVVRGEIITVSTEADYTPVEVPEWAPGEESICWTRQVDGSYLKEGSLAVKEAI
jgi:hypothetical protein